jgi:hypothetical protein
MGIQLKKINLNEAIGKLDDKMIEMAIETDNVEKLKELKQIEKQKVKEKIINYFVFWTSSFAVVILGIFIINSMNYNNVVQIPNPIVSIDSLNELSNYLGLSTEKFDFKEIKNINKYQNEIFGEIIYKDDSTLRISKGKSDNSGIYGSALVEETVINNVEVQIYSLEKIEYATWQKDGYSYSYRKSNDENIKDIIKKIIGE